MNPWDAAARDVTVLRGEEHNIIGVHVSPPAGDDDRFSIEFRTTGDRVLRVRLPGDQLQSLARVLTELAEERASGLLPSHKPDIPEELS
jgi:hypothetical protein